RVVEDRLCRRPVAPRPPLDVASIKEYARGVWLRTIDLRPHLWRGLACLSRALSGGASCDEQPRPPASRGAPRRRGTSDTPAALGRASAGSPRGAIRDRGGPLRNQYPRR